MPWTKTKVCTVRNWEHWDFCLNEAQQSDKTIVLAGLIQITLTWYAPHPAIERRSESIGKRSCYTGFAVSLFVDIRAKPHRFPLVELDWHFGNPSAQERFKSSYLRSQSNTELSYRLKMAREKMKVEELAEKRNNEQQNGEGNEAEKGSGGKGE